MFVKVSGQVQATYIVTGQSEIMQVTGPVAKSRTVRAGEPSVGLAIIISRNA